MAWVTTPPSQHDKEESMFEVGKRVRIKQITYKDDIDYGSFVGLTGRIVGIYRDTRNCLDNQVVFDEKGHQMTWWRDEELELIQEKKEETT
jgi:hypothetical protein